MAENSGSPTETASAEDKPDAWYYETAKRVYRPDIYLKAAQALVAEGHLAASEVPKSDGFKVPDSGFIDGVVYDGRKPNAYLGNFEIGNQGKRTRTAAR